MRLVEEILYRCEVQEDGCWIYQGARTPKGYGQVAWRGGFSPAHRVVYEELVGPIPEGLVLDHTCHDAGTCAGGNTCPHRACLNPLHLEPVTSGENTRRAFGQRVPRSHCGKGHPLSGENLHIRSKGERSCRICERDYQRAWSEAKRREQGAGVANSERTHCPQGHPYDEVNTYVAPDGKRQCRTCRDARQRARYALRRAESCAR